jgi:hypothetical protein
VDRRDGHRGSSMTRIDDVILLDSVFGFKSGFELPRMGAVEERLGDLYLHVNVSRWGIQNIQIDNCMRRMSYRM